MTTDTRVKIVEYIRTHNQARVSDLVPFLRLSHVAIHKQLKKLILDGTLEKVGTPPLVFYKIKTTEETSFEKVVLAENTRNVVEDNFLSITPDGKFLYGVRGFAYWANLYQPKEKTENLAKKYAELIREKGKIAPDGFLDATKKIKEAFPEPFVDHLLYEDIYSYPLFGRTKLAKMVMYAKQSQDITLTHQIAIMAKPVIKKVIKMYKIQAVGFIPPTVPRQNQFMEILQKGLNVSLPLVDLVKIMPGEIPIPQKTLQRVDERIINARSSIYMRDIASPSYASVLLIDDVAGSGASFHETARKLKSVKIGHKSIIAFAIVGNLKGYDVIRQM